MLGGNGQVAGSFGQASASQPIPAAAIDENGSETSSVFSASREPQTQGVQGGVKQKAQRVKKNQPGARVKSRKVGTIHSFCGPLAKLINPNSFFWIS